MGVDAAGCLSFSAISARTGGRMFATFIRKFSVGVIVLVPLFLFTVARPAAAQTDKDGDGAKLFDTNCAKCHGPDGSGNTAIGKAVGAKDLRSAEAQKLTDAQIYTQIDQGKGNMPPFGGTLNKAQIDSLIPYVRQLSKKPSGAKKSS
jgi:mono/diheme cytochrome c family protein